LLGLALLLALLLLSPSEASAGQQKKGNVSFIRDVAPILKESCFACHDAKKRKGKLDMTTYEGLRKGGDKEDPVVPGKAEESLLIDLVTAKDNSRMPPPKEGGEALSRDKVAVLEQWIKEGAKLDEGLTPKSDLVRELRYRWSPPSPPAAYRFPVTITALAFTPDGQKLVVGGYHELTVWDVATARLEKRIATRAERAKAMVFLPDGKLAVAGGRPGQEGDVRIFDLQASAGRVDSGVAMLDGVHDPKVMVKQLLDADDEVLCLALSPDGKKLASGGSNDRLVNVWDLSPGYAAAKLEQTIENHADWVMGVAFSPDGKHLLTCSRDKTAKVWDLATKESVLTFPDHQTTVYGVAVHANGKVGFSVGEDNQLRFWNAVGEGKQIRAVGGHGKPVVRVLRHPTQPLLLTCSADGTVRVWNAENGAAVRTLSGHTDWVYALAISPDGNLVASGSWNGEVKVWKLADGSLVKAFNASPGL
jgi:WD40 repeat protein